MGSKGLEEIAKQTLSAPQDSPRGDFLYHVTNGNGTLKGFLLTFLPLEGWTSEKMYYFCCQKQNITRNMEAIIERTPSRITVSMSLRRWNRMLQLEETYKLARIIKRSMKQVESEPSMTPEEAVAALRAL